MNSTTIRVWWRPPDPQLINGINQGYKLQAWRGNEKRMKVEWKNARSFLRSNSIYLLCWRSLSDDDQQPEKTVTVPPSPFDPLAEQTALIDGVQKFTEYRITVLCFTSPGDGPRSADVHVKTAEDGTVYLHRPSVQAGLTRFPHFFLFLRLLSCPAVPEEVANLRFDEISDRSVRVSWSPPEKSNGLLTGYTVRWSVKDVAHTIKVKNVTANTTSLVVNSLQVHHQAPSINHFLLNYHFPIADDSLHVRSGSVDE